MQVINPATPAADTVPTAVGATASKGAGYSPFAGAMYEQADPRRYIAVILSHWWIVLLILLLGTAIGAAYCIRSTPQYQAICRYEIYSDERLQLGNRPANLEARQRSRQVLIITGSNLRGLVNAKLQPKWQGVIPNLDATVSVRPVREVESMMDISVDTVSGEYALDYLKELLNEYQEVQRTRALETNESSMRSLWVEKQRLATEMEEAQNAMLKFQKEHNIRFSEAKKQFDDQFLEGLIQRQSTLRMERTMLETQFPFLEQANTATIQGVLQLTMETHAATAGTGAAPAERPPSTPTATGTPPATTGATATSKSVDGAKPLGPISPLTSGWQQQEELVARLEAEYQDMLAVYKPNHPHMRDLQRYLGAAKRELRFGAETALKRLKARLDATTIQERALDSASRTWRSEISLSVAERATYDTLNSKVEHLKQLHDQVYTRILDGTSQNVDVTFNHMVEPPRIVGIVWPNRFKIMTFSMLAALCAGILLTFALDFLDTSMTDVMAIEERLGLQYLSSIPNWDRLIPNLDMKNAQVVVRRDKANVTSEVYRSLRSSLENVIGTKKGYSLTITSTEANEGKSMTAINLAVTFSWTGKKVLLVDGDLRRGRLHSTFGLDAKTGLTDFLLGKVADWHDLAVPTSYENLSLVPVGTYHNAAPELLDPARMKQLVADWGTEFDIIIFDTAPVGRVVDSARIARATDGVLLVTRHGHCTFAGVRHALHRLEGSTIIGFCLNGIEVTGRHLGYFHYYGYFRRFGRYGHYAYENYYDRYKYGQYGYGADKDKKKKEAEGAAKDADAKPKEDTPA